MDTQKIIFIITAILLIIICFSVHIAKKRKKSFSITNDMIKYLESYSENYFSFHEKDKTVLQPIFKYAKKIIRKVSYNDVAQSNAPLESIVLNILQNSAMIHIKPISAAEWIAGGRNEDKAHELYNYINEEKLKKNYISEQQFKENEVVGDKASLIPPTGRWL